MNAAQRIDTQKAIGAAIDLARHIADLNARNWESYRAGYSNYAFAQMFNTIRLNFGRGTGHSTYIRNNATDDDLIIYRDAWQMDNEIRSIKNDPLVVRIDRLDPVLRGRTIRGNVWIDTASMLSKSDFEKIDEALAPLSQSGIKQIIMLG